MNTCIDTVACPSCRAAVGERCADRLTPHRARVVAWRDEMDHINQVWADEVYPELQAEWDEEERRLAENDRLARLKMRRLNMLHPIPTKGGK